MGPRVDLGEPGVELVLEIQVVGELAARLEVRLGLALHPLDRAFGLRVGRLAEAPRDLQLPAERSERLARAAGVAVDAGLAIPNELRRQCPQARQAARDAREQILSSLLKISTPAPARE